MLMPTPFFPGTSDSPNFLPASLAEHAPAVDCEMPDRAERPSSRSVITRLPGKAEQPCGRSRTPQMWSVLCFYLESGWLSSPAWLRSMWRFRGTPFGPELPAARPILVAEHGRVPHSPAGWQIAVVVLRCFVAVLIVGTSHWVSASWPSLWWWGQSARTDNLG